MAPPGAGARAPGAVRSNRRRLLIRLARACGRDTVALASYPRSGNTWLALLIEALSGRGTGSIYQDREHTRPALGLVIKTHRRDGPLYRRHIHLVRHPLRALDSYYDYHRRIARQELDWGVHVAQETQAWATHTEYWLGRAAPGLRVRFEDLREDPAGELARVADYLHIGATPLRLAQAVETCGIERLRARSKLGADFFRTGARAGVPERFTTAQLDGLARRAGHLIETLGYGPLPDQRARAAARSASE